MTCALLRTVSPLCQQGIRSPRLDEAHQTYTESRDTISQTDKICYILLGPSQQKLLIAPPGRQKRQTMRIALLLLDNGLSYGGLFSTNKVSVCT